MTLDPFFFPESIVKVPPKKQNKRKMRRYVKRKGLLELIREAEKNAIEDYKWHSTNMYASSASCIDSEGNVRGACARGTYYRCMKAPMFHDVGNTYVANTAMYGDAWEDYLIKTSEKFSVLNRDLVAKRIKIPEIRLAGKTDIGYNDNGKCYLVEAKSATEKKFDGIVKGIYNYKPPQPADSHLMQTMIYLDYLWKNDGIEEGSIVYGDRSTGREAEFYVSLCERKGKTYPIIALHPEKTYKIVTDFTLESIYDRFLYVIACVDNEIVPRRDYELWIDNDTMEEIVSKNKQKLRKREKERWKHNEIPAVQGICPWCQYVETCWGEDPRWSKETIVDIERTIRRE